MSHNSVKDQTGFKIPFPGNSSAISDYRNPFSKAATKQLELKMSRIGSIDDGGEMLPNPFTPTQRMILDSIYGKKEKFFAEGFLANHGPGIGNVSPTFRRQTSFNNNKLSLLPEINTKDELKAKDSKRLKHLKTLFKNLTKIFAGKTLDDGSHKLTPFELGLLEHILHRKFHLTAVLQNNEKYVQELNNACAQIILQKSSKRKEENIKFIYKWIMKKLKKDFPLASHESPAESNAKFYDFYFDDIAKKLNVSVEAFHDPTNQEKRAKGNSASKYKSINTDFLKHIFLSEKFLKDFKTCLESPELEKEYQKKLHKKIEKLLLRWDKLNTKHSFDQLMDKADSYFKASVRCKLPWTLNEIVSAKEYFLKFLRNL